MKKNKISLFLTLILLTALIFIGISFYASKAYYPELYFDGGSKKDVVEKLKKSNDELVELANVDGFYWLGFKGNALEGRNKIIKQMESQGLKYEYNEGNGIFFENGERVIVTGRQWTGDYILYKVPETTQEYMN